ncbi:MAG: hypothetical protein HY319_21090 [Armatimonadetes bacterium]|nr:hypothetical protein [Armatimonadota bacterium]
MIRTINSGAVAPASLPTYNSSAAPAQQQPPAPPSDSVDFSKIDTPAKAAALPALDPAVQLGLAAGVAAMIMSAMGGGGMPLVTLDVLSKTGGIESSANYTLDGKNEANPVSVSGDFAGQALSGGLVINEQEEKIGWVGQIGSSPEEIQFAGMDEEKQTVNLSCKFGDIQGNLSFSPLPAQEGPVEYAGYKIEGDLGGTPYSTETTWKLPDMQEPPQDGRLEASFSTVGKLGDADIRKDYQLVAQMTGSGVVVDVNGSGNVAGIPQEVQATLTLIP